MRRYDRFTEGSGCYNCRMCGRATRSTGDNESTRLCPACYEWGQWEALHNDEGHKDRPHPDCPICKEAK